MPWERIEAEFRLEDVTRAPAFFDEKKLTAFNKEYLKALPPEDFVAACEPWLPEHYDRATFAEIAPLLQSRVGTLAEAPAMVDFLFAEPEVDEASWTKAMRPEWAGELLDQVIKAYQSAPWDAETLKTRVAPHRRHARRQAQARRRPGACRSHRKDGRAHRCSSPSSCWVERRRSRRLEAARGARAVVDDGRERLGRARGH